jgi:glycosyltransferase 2 family protein
VRAVVSDREPRRHSTLPRRLTLFLQLAVSVGLLAALIAVVDWDRLRDAAAALTIGTLIAVAALCLAAQAALVLRWRALLDMLGVRESWARSWHSVFAGLFLGNFLPGTLGSDGLRVVLLTKSCGRASTAIGAVAYERLMQLALYVLVVATAALSPMPWLQPWLRAGIVGVGIVGVLLLIFILYWLGQRSVDGAMARGGVLQAAWRLIATILTETGRMQTRMRRHRRAALGFWVASIANVCLIFAIWRMILSDFGDEAGIPTIVLAAGGAAIATAVPISLNGIGIFEGAIVGILGLAGVPAAHGFLLALIVRAVFMTSSFLGWPSAALLWRERRSE